MTIMTDPHAPNLRAGGFAAMANTSAANDDHLSSKATTTLRRSVADTGGWCAYDVWRRLIKEARERREQASDSTLRP
jgi:hypothetical protein